MPPQNTTALIRLGILALPLAGLLVVGTLGDLNSPDPNVDPGGAVQGASSTGYFLSQFVGNILGVMLVIFSVIALFAYLVNIRVGSLASWAMVFSVLGFCLLLSFLGIVTYAIPAIAQEYLNGQQNAIQIADAIFSSGTTTVVIFLASLLYFVGFILFGVAIWRSEVLPKWVRVVLAISGLLLAVPVPLLVTSILGSVLFIIVGGWIALSVWQQPSARVEAEDQPRVR